MSADVGGTSGGSRLIISARSGADLAIHSINILGGGIGAIIAGVNILGNIIVDGPTRLVKALDVKDDHTIRLGGDATDKPVKVKLGNVQNVAFSSGAPIKKFKALDWDNTDAVADTFDAPWVKSLRVRGDMDANITLSGAGGPALTLAKVRVDGAVRGAKWAFTGDSGVVDVRGRVEGLDLSVMSSLKKLKLADVRDATVEVDDLIKTVKAKQWLKGLLSAKAIGSAKITGDAALGLAGDLGANVVLKQAASATTRALRKLVVAGAMKDMVLNSAGHVGPITADALSNARLYAGVSAGVVGALGFPAAAADFGADVSIGNITLRNKSAADSLVDSIIAARRLGTLKLGTVKLSNAGKAFGVAADQIRTLTGSSATTGPLRFTNLDDAVQVNDAVAAGGLDLIDFDVRLV